MGTVRRETANFSESIVVSLSTSDSSAASVPVTVAIPAEQSTATFLISAVDDTLLGVPLNVIIPGRAAGYPPATRSLIISDRDSLGVSLADSSIAEVGRQTKVTIGRSDSDELGDQSVDASTVFSPANEHPAGKGCSWWRMCL